MDRNELYKHLVETDKKFEKAKEKRAIKTILAFAVVFFIFLCLDEKPSGIEFVLAAVVSVVFSGIYFVVNSLVFGYLALQGDAERKYLEAIKKKLYPDQEDI